MHQTAKLLRTTCIMVALALVSANGSPWQRALAQSFESPQPVLTGGASPLMSGRDITLQGTESHSDLMAGRSITGSGCTMAGQLQAGQDIQLHACQVQGPLAAGRHVEIRETTVQSSVKAGGHLTLESSTVQGDVMAGAGATLSHAQINGTLQLATEKLILDASTLGALQLSPPTSARVEGYGMMTAQQSLITNGNGSFVSMGKSGVSNINGYTVKSLLDQTTVLTPDNNIYVNDRRVSGEGPASYTAYQAQHKDAPNVQGPGWRKDTPLEASGFSSTTQIVELRNQSRIQGDVVFEAGQGKVLLHPGSSISGKIHGGKLEQLPN